MRTLTTTLTLFLLSTLIHAEAEDTAKVKITHIFINDRPVSDTSGTLRLLATDDDLVFEFEKPDNDTNGFSYKLDGFEKKFKTTQHPTASTACCSMRD